MNAQKEAFKALKKGNRKSRLVSTHLNQRAPFQLNNNLISFNLIWLKRKSEKRSSRCRIKFWIRKRNRPIRCPITRLRNPTFDKNEADPFWRKGEIIKARR